MTQATTTLSDEQENKIALKNVWLYLVCQSFGGAAAPVCIALGGLVGSHLLGPDKSLATAPVTAYTVGVAFGALLANSIMRRYGRKRGFMIGACIGIAGMLFSGFAIMMAGFWLFCGGMAVSGLSSGFVQQYRFAAADRGTAKFKPTAISIIMLGGVVAAVVGPQLAIHARDLAQPVPFAGAFFAATTLFVLCLMVLSMLNPSGLQPSDAADDNEKPMRSVMEIVSQPAFAIAALCGMASYSLMSFVMTGAPLAMVHHGHSMDNATLGIQWHVMAMFAPSLITGFLIARFGKIFVTASGLLILVACAVVALAGLELIHFWGSLILLGLGWNFGFIGATSMITETYRPQERNRAQGANDFIVFGSVAFASLMSGFVLNAYGWNFLNLVIFPVVAVCLLGLAWLKVQDKRAES